MAAVKFDILARDLASDKFKRVGDSAERSSGKLAAVGRVGKMAALGLVAGIGMAVVAGAKFAQMAAEDEVAVKQMAVAFRNSAGATKAQIAATEDWISAQGAAKGVADDQLRPALSNLVRATGDVGKAQRLASLAMDVSAGTGKDLGAVSMALAKAQNGNVGALSRLGIKTKDATGKTMSLKQVMGQLGEKFRGAASAHAETFAGRMERLKLIGSELGESIGYKILPYLTKFAGFLLTSVVPAVSKLAGWIGARLGPAFAAIGVFVGKAVAVFQRFGAGVSKAGGPLQRLGGWIRANVLPAIRDVASFIQAKAEPVIAAFGEVWRSKIQPALQKADEKFRAMQPALSTVGKFLISVQAAAVKLAASIIGKLLTVVVKLAGWLFSKLVPALVTVISGVVRAAAAVIRFGGSLRAGVSAAAAFASGLKTKIGKAIEFVRSIPDKIKKVFSSAGKWLLSAGRKIIEGLIDGIKGAFGKLKSVLSSVTKLIPKWKGPPERDATLLVPAGRAIMGGLIGSIGGEVPALRRQLRAVTDVVAAMAAPRVQYATAGVSRATQVGGPAGQAELVAALAAALGAVTFRIEGDALVGLLNRYNRRQGRR